MICYKCGRTINDDAVICVGCGAQQYQPERIKIEPVSQLMKKLVSPEKSKVTIGGVVGRLSLLIVVLLVVGASFPYVRAFVGDFIASHNEVTSPVVESTASEIDEVSGEILKLNARISDCAVVSETAYDDGSWEKVFLVNKEITVKTLRCVSNEDWINTHIFALYPDVENVSAVSPVPSYSDCAAIRIRFDNTQYAEGCTVEAVLIKSANYDHIFIVEMPNDYFDDYLVWINEWINSLVLVDAETENVIAGTVSVTDV